MTLLSDLRKRALGNLVIEGTLTVVDTITTDQLVITNADAGTAITVNQIGEMPIAEFKKDGTTTLLIKGDKVGIGTNSPNATLDVVGTAKIQTLSLNTSTGVLKSSSTGLITSSLITDADISNATQIDWSKINKETSSLNDLGTPTADYSFGSRRLTSLADPQDLQDAATKKFVMQETSSRGLSTLGDVSFSSLSQGNVIILGSDGYWANKSISGDILISPTGEATINDGAISNTNISNFASIEFSKLESLYSNRVVLTDAYGVITTADVSDVELSYLKDVSSSIQEQLDSKQPLGEYLTHLEGEVESSSDGYVVLSDQAVTSKLLTGLSIEQGEVFETDSLLVAIGKLSASMHESVTIASGATNGLTLVGQELSLAAASASSSGALLVTDWNTFNDKEPAITTLAISKGGTGNSALNVTSGSLIYADGTKLVSLPMGSEGQHLSISSGNLVWKDLLRASTYDDLTRPSAAEVSVGTIIFNSDDNTLNVSDGYDWRDMLGSVT